MARKADSGWRDTLLGVRHQLWGFDAPAAGMVLTMVEYDRGKAVGLVNYLPYRPDFELPKGEDAVRAYTAFSRVADQFGVDELPFLTARYDTGDWSMHVFPHNDAARALVGRKGWLHISEASFAQVLYAMRGKVLPDLSSYGVTWNLGMWPDGSPRPDGGFERWPGEPMSVRRRNYEPTAAIPFGLRVPCLDIDLAVIDRGGYLAAVVDYKSRSLPGGRGGSAQPDLHSTNCKALASLASSVRQPVRVAAYVVEYAPVKPSWEFTVYCLNESARLNLAYALGASDARTAALAHAVVGNGVSLTEDEWTGVLRCLRDV